MRIETATRVLGAEQATKLIGEPVDDRTTDRPWSTGSLVVDEETREPVYAYVPLDRVAVGDLRRAVLATSGASYTAYRAGLRNASRTFGWTPRRPLYGREGCQPASMAVDNPDTERVLDQWAGRLTSMLHELVPDRLAADVAATAPIAPDWKLGDTHYTSGVINRSAQLPYHRDVFNYPVWSAMPVLRRGVSGGYLHIPEYDALIPCRDGWGVFFPGQQLVHGVTPMYLHQPDGYRYSIVYYSLRGLKDCFTAAVEAGYAKARRTTRERDIAARLKTGDTRPAGARPTATGDPSAIEDAFVNGGDEA